MTKHFLLFTLSISSLLISSCTDDELIDTTAPEISLESPENMDYLTAGEYVNFKANFTDDRELATYNIEIHENFDGHSHGRIAGVNTDPDLVKWSYNQSFLIPGGNIEFLVESNNEIPVPDNTLGGPYHFIVRAIDQAGNSTNFQDGSNAEHEVFITNESMPEVDITNLSNDELDIEVGETFLVTGSVTDPTDGEYAGMHAMEIVLGEGHEGEHDHDHGGRLAEDDLIDFDIEEEALESFMVDDSIILDLIFEDINFNLTQEQLNELIAEGVDHLQLMIKVHDNQGNIAISNINVHIHMD